MTRQAGVFHTGDGAAYSARPTWARFWKPELPDGASHQPVRPRPGMVAESHRGSKFTRGEHIDVLPIPGAPR